MNHNKTSQNKQLLRGAAIGSVALGAGILGYSLLSDNKESHALNEGNLESRVEKTREATTLDSVNENHQPVLANVGTILPKPEDHVVGCGCGAHANTREADALNKVKVKVAPLVITKDFRKNIFNHSKGDAVEFSLPGGGVASGVVEFTSDNEGRTVVISGRLVAPMKGNFYFNEELLPGFAGEFSGGAYFDESDVAYSVEPNANGAPELHEKDVSEVVCRSYFPRLTETAASVTEEAPEQIATDHPSDGHVPDYQNGVIPLESLPGVTAVAYLDFDGEEGPFVSWGDFDAASPGLSDSQMRVIWQRVAEDFAPFNINVTTDLQVFLDAPTNSRIRCIITPTNTAAPGAGGVAFVGDFNRTLDRVCWTFITSGKNSAEATSHEIGHTMGLVHDGTLAGAQYYPGHGSGDVSWSPIMGTGYHGNLSQWSKGEYFDANNFQDDVSILANNNNNLSHRTDDHGATLVTASNLEISSDDSVANEGVIETSADEDGFKFTVTSSSLVTLNINGAGLGPNLDILAEIVDSSGSVVVSSNPNTGVDASISTTLSVAGEYFLRVSGVGYGSATATGYTDYGSLGEYKVSGSVTNSVVPDRFTIAENPSNGAAVGSVTPNNAHGSDSVIYTIASGNSSGAFTIDANGALTVADPAQFNYEALSTYHDDLATFDLSVDIANSTNPGLTETVRVVVTVSNVNEAPVMVSTASTLTILERLATGTEIWQASATEVDNYDGVTYTISSGNSQGHFAIEPDTGEVTINSLTDGAITPSYNLTITATDNGSHSDSVVLTVNIVDFDNQHSPGSISVSYFDGISGGDVLDLTSDPDYPAAPDEATILMQFSHINHGTDYGSQVRGYVIAPATGNYTFWISSDDSSELYLSSDDSAANKALIASVSGATNVGDWSQFSSQQSVAVTLTAGQVYYIEALHKDTGGGSDHLQVAWQGPGITQQVIPGSFLAPLYENYAPVVADESLDFQLNASNGATVVQVLATDSNSIERVGNYTILSGNTNGAFAINSSTGEISIANAAGLVKGTTVVLEVEASDNGSPIKSDTAMITINIKNFLVRTGFESADGFTGYSTAAGGTTLNATTDNLGAQWSTSDDARIINNSGNAMEGAQLMTLGWDTRPNSTIITIPGTNHGVGNVMLHYASFSSSTNCDVSLHYRIDGGAWIQSWTTHLGGLNPNYLSKPWPAASIDVNQDGDVDLKIEVTGSSKGVFLDNIEVLPYSSGTSPVDYVATNQSTTSGSNTGISGSLISDDVYEVLTEAQSTTNPASQRISFLEHQWNFEITTPGSAVTLEVEAFHSANSENDNFVFGYSTDGTNFTDVLTVTKTSDDDVKQTTALPANLSGTVYIRVKDTDPNTAGNSVQDALSVDYLAISVDPPNFAPAVVDSIAEVSEFASINTPVVTVDAGDPNGLDTHTYAITAGNGSGTFAIDNNGTITTLTALDHETTAQYVLTVEVTDQGSLSDSGTITVKVTDVAEAPVAQDDTLVINANEASTAGTVLSNDTANSTQGSTILGIIQSVALYDAGTAGAPTSPTTQGWIESDSESDNDASIGNSTGLASINDNGSGLDAWVVTDNIDGAGFVTYTATPTAAQTASGTNNGWMIDTKMRFVDDFNDDNSTVLIYGNGSQRFVIFFDLDANDDLTAKLVGTGGGTYTLTSGSTGAAEFHDIALSFDPINSTAAFSVDGVRHDTGSWSGDSNVFNGLQFGNGSSGGQGSAAFHKVQLSVLANSTTLASGASIQVTGNDLVFNTNGVYDSLELGQSANESVTYVISNGTDLSSTASVDITINGVDDQPTFNTDPIIATAGMIFDPYTGTLATYGDDPDASDTPIFSKVSGPAWLSVATDGTMSGTPSASDAGVNSFTVQVSDGNGNIDQATLQITVASIGSLFSDNFQGYDVENPTDFSVGTVATGNWTASNTTLDATRIFNTGNFGGTRLWISNVDGSALTSKGINVGSNAHYSMSSVLLVETAGTTTVNATYDILVGQSAATATSIIGGAQPIVANGDGYQVANSKTDHVFTHSFQTSTVNAGDQLFVRYTRVNGGGWFGVDDVDVSLVSGNTAPVVTDATFAVAENSAVSTAVGTVIGIDADGSVSLAITAGNSAGHFTLDSATGALTTTAVAVDYETATSHVLTITGTDLGGLTDTATITVNVTNVTTGDDSDGDNINDDWEVANYSNTGSANGADDTDGDGFDSFHEMVFGSDPTAISNVDDYVQKSVIVDAGTEKLELSFRRPINYATLNVTYALESSTTLTGWAPDGTLVTSTTPDADGITEWVNYRFTISAHSKCFIRMSATPNL